MPEDILHYRLIRKIGAGGMGEVFLAQDTRLQRQVALKLLPDELARDPLQRRRFMREARTASALSHPNICVIHEVGEAADGRLFIAMEFIEGQSLDARLQTGPLAISDIIAIAVQAADALAEAHRKGLVHRDVKPANILLNARGEVKVLDFGLAKWVEGDKLADSVSRTTSVMTTTPGTVLGTPVYMSPEQVLGRPVDARSDVFSFGVVLYQIVTGRLPFSGSTFAELAHRIVDGRYEAVARFNYEVPAELERIIRKCLARELEKRFQSGHDLLVDLQELRRTLSAEGAGGGLPASGKPLDAVSPDTITFDAGDARDPALPPAPAAVPAGESDVLLAYAPLDDRPVIAGKQGWITQLHRNLELRVAQLSGKQVQVWRPPEPAAPIGTPDPVLERVPEAKTCISVVSPPFVRTSGCRRIVKTFWKSAQSSGLLEINHRARIVQVVKSPVEANDIPEDIRGVLARLVPFEFFERDPQSGRVREFDEAFGELARQRFHERVYDVAYEIAQVLRCFGAAAPERAAGTSLKTIYLAATTSDLEAQRDQIRRELTELGHEVLPKKPLPMVAGELAAVVRACLEHCDLAIHLVGAYYGLVPEATELSIVALQNQVAAEYSDATGLERLIWLPKGITAHDERQAVFLREIARDPAAHRCADVVIDTLEGFKVLLRARWKRPEATSSPPVAKGAAAPPRVYLICDQRDEAEVEPLQDFFYERGIDVSLPPFELGEAEFQKAHVGNLNDCDAALVYYGAGGMHWVDFNLRDLQKAAGYRESVPIGAQAVYIAPPLDRRKERFKSVSAEILRQTGERFDPALLEGFAAAARSERDKRR